MRFRNIGIIQKMVIVSAYCLAIGVIASACRSSVGITSEKEEVTMMAGLNKAFTLGIGKEAILQEEELMIRFVTIEKDSRCPTGMKCVWEGDAEVSLEVKVLGRVAKAITLHTSKRFDQEEKYSLYTLRLVSLTPYPKKGEEINPEDYIVTLRVQKD